MPKRTTGSNQPAEQSLGQRVISKVGKKSPGRVIELDILRGFLLVWMTLTHLPTKASIISNQTFGFVSGAEGFIFLAAFMVGQIEARVERRAGEIGTLRDLCKRTLRVYLYHTALLIIAFTVIARIGVSMHRLAVENLLSFYLQEPRHAVIAGLLLKYRPSLFDILPMYIFFMMATPLARWVARRWSWDVVIYTSFAVWACAQFGLRHWMYVHVNLIGIRVPENSTGAFDMYGWQFLWMVGLALGAIYADNLASETPRPEDTKIPKSLFRLSVLLALIFLVLRYSPADHWIDGNVYGWLIDKWHLGPARLINFSVLAIVLMRIGPWLAALPFIKPLAALGQASIEVFSVHVLCCIAGDALSKDADPNLPWWQQAVLLVFTLGALFLTADAHKKRLERKQNALRMTSQVSR